MKPRMLISLFLMAAMLLLSGALLVDESWPRRPTDDEVRQAAQRFFEEYKYQQPQIRDILRYHPREARRMVLDDHLLLVFEYQSNSPQGPVAVYGVAELLFANQWKFDLRERFGTLRELDRFREQLFAENNEGWVPEDLPTLQPPQPTPVGGVQPPEARPAAGGKVVGLGGTARVPGPENAGQALVGILLPALICLIASLFMQPAATGALLSVQFGAAQPADTSVPVKAEYRVVEGETPAAELRETTEDAIASTAQALAEPVTAPDWALVTVEGADAGLVTPLPDRLTLGRSKKCDIRIKDARAALRHAIIERRVDGIWLIDQESPNGTRLNGELVSQPVQLKDGDIIGIAGEQFRVTGGALPAACRHCGAPRPPEAHYCPRCGNQF